MGIGKLIMTAITIVVLMFIVVTAINLIVPISKNQNFDEICRSYALLMEKKGGLSGIEKSEIGGKVASLNLQNITIEAPNYGQTRFGEKMYFKVKAECIIKMGGAGMHIFSKRVPFIYQRSMFCREIELE